MLSLRIGGIRIINRFLLFLFLSEKLEKQGYLQAIFSNKGLKGIVVNRI